MSVADLERAWDEGYRSSELLKRYTTATMGPCQGAMCGRHLAAFAAARGAAANAASRTTARPLARPTPLDILAAPVHEVIEKRTSLHDVHVAAGARIGWSGAWLRPFGYGDREREYRAVRDHVSAMDVGTLGKFLVTGADATALVEASFPTRIDDLEPGRARYLLALDEAGYVFDDGLLCSLGPEGWYLTSTSGGADRMEAWLRDRADRLGLRAHVLDMTAERGAILVAGPRSRELLAGLTDDPLDRDAFPHMGVRELTVAGVPCGAIRTGFVGEIAFELHHPRSRGPELWGRDRGGRSPSRSRAPRSRRAGSAPAREGPPLCRSGHVARRHAGQARTRLGRAPGGSVHRETSARAPRRDPAGAEAGRSGVRSRRCGAPGCPARTDGRIAGRVTSAARSPVLDRSIGLGWIRRAPGGGFPDDLRADRVAVRVVPTPFYDPEGNRLHG